MKKLLIICLFFIYGRNLAHGQALQFREDLDWPQLLAIARTEHKNIFLDVMATWCSPCKAMDQSVYPDSQLGKFIDDNFIAVKIQTDQTKGDSEFVKSWYDAAKLITNRYQVSSLPSMIFLTHDGKLLYKSVGFRNAKELISDAKRALNPTSRYDLMIEDYFSGNRGKFFINSLIHQTDSLGRKIMAQKIGYESQSSEDSNSAYSILSRLYKAKNGKSVGNFLGDWEIDYPVCEFGDKPLRAAAKKIRIIALQDAVQINRFSSDGSGGEVLSQESVGILGKPKITDTGVDNRKKISRVFICADGRSFTEFSEITFPDEKSIDYVLVEEWNLLTDSKLQIIKTAYMNGSSYTLKLIYKKK